MLFIATSHRLADFIFSLGNHCLQLSDRERIDVKLKITSDLRFVNQMKNNLLIFSDFMVENRFNRGITVENRFLLLPLSLFFLTVTWELSFLIDFFSKTTLMRRESASVVIVVVKYVDPAGEWHDLLTFFFHYC
ncbi:hypothetical protein Bca101_091472 [Brassica carinata]